MIFYEKAIKNKEFYLDSIKNNEELLNKCISKYYEGSYELINLKRTWEPGGGSTLYKVISNDKSYFLKVKHNSVCIESKLEAEQNFLETPSLLNEYNFLSILPKENIPNVYFFEEMNSYQFLCVEYLDTFDTAVSNMTINELIEAWGIIVEFTRELFKKGIVHTDIHEKNICFRNKIPVIVDFEEARYFNQDVQFDKSLDFIGENQYGNLGHFPAEYSSIKGFTCLSRLRNVFNKIILNKIPELINQCNFDNSCNFNLDELQTPDSRIYQSIDINGLKIEGQRPANDPRIKLFLYFLKKLNSKSSNITYIDIGSNMGKFCFKASSQKFVGKSIGLEAFHKYVDFTNALKFLNNDPKVSFHVFECGNDKISSIIEEANFVTMLSVYHHIKNKDAILNELQSLKLDYLLVEMATQERYYKERGSLKEEINYIFNKTGFKYKYTLCNTKDYDRPLILFSNKKISFFDKIISKIVIR